MTMSHPPPPSFPLPQPPQPPQPPGRLGRLGRLAAAPPLSARQKRGAFWAGFLALNLIDLGGSLVLLAALLGVAFAFASFLIRLASTGEPGSPLGPEPRAFLESLTQADAPVWLAALALIGVLVLAGGVLVSYGVLSRSGVARPWAVTWSAVGLSLPALAVLGFVVSVGSQLAGVVAFFGSIPWQVPYDRGLNGAEIVLGGTIAAVGLLLTVTVIGIVGWLLWWWMAHALRVPV